MKELKELASVLDDAIRKLNRHPETPIRRLLRSYTLGLTQKKTSEMLERQVSSIKRLIRELEAVNLPTPEKEALQSLEEQVLPELEKELKRSSNFTQRYQKIKANYSREYSNEELESTRKFVEALRELLDESEIEDLTPEEQGKYLWILYYQIPLFEGHLKRMNTK